MNRISSHSSRTRLTAGGSTSSETLYPYARTERHRFSFLATVLILVCVGGTGRCWAACEAGISGTCGYWLCAYQGTDCYCSQCDADPQAASCCDTDPYTCDLAPPNGTVYVPLCVEYGGAGGGGGGDPGDPDNQDNCGDWWDDC